MVYPEWLKDLFKFFNITYLHLWTDRLVSEEMTNMTLSIWHHHLKGFDVELIKETAWEASKKHDFPPTPKQFLDIIKLKKDKVERENHFKNQHEVSLLPEPEKAPMPENIKIQVREMFLKLGLPEIAKKYEVIPVVFDQTTGEIYGNI